MKRIIIMSSSGLILFICIGLIIHFYISNIFMIGTTNKDRMGGNFLKDKIAILYYSTTIDTRPGKGFVIFVDKKGETYPLKTEGLELGRIGYDRRSVFFQDENNSYLLSDRLKKSKRKPSQFTGDYVGTLKGNQKYYYIFNTGVEKDDSYRSDIYWQKGEQLKKGVLPYFIQTRGEHKDTIYTIASKKDMNDYTLYQTRLSDTAQTKEIMTWVSSKADSSPLGNIYFFKNHLYYLEESNPQNGSEYIRWVDVQLDSKKLRYIPVTTYRSSNQQDQAMPYDDQKCSYLYSHNLYYINGEGQVYKTDISTKKTTKRFEIGDLAQNDDFVQTEWKNDRLYVYYEYTNGSKQSAIETYNIVSGKKTDVLKVKGMPEVTGKNRGLFSYDLVILD